MSIFDEGNEDQPLMDGGLCIYTTKSTIVDSCYFFAFFSRRSGSAILFEEIDEYVEAKVVNSMFKSITQESDYYDDYVIFTGGAISYGALTYDDNIYGSFLHSSLTENCCFDKVRLSLFIFGARLFGVVTYISDNIKSTNLNFTNNEYWIYCGAICFLAETYLNNSFSFINIFNCEYDFSGTFTVILRSEQKVELSISFANFIDNHQDFISDFIIIETKAPQIIIMNMASGEALLNFSSINCNNKKTFFGSFTEETIGPINIIVSDSVFACSFQDLIEDKDLIILCELSENNIFNYNDFNIEITNNIISNFGYIQTSQFTASNTFSNSLIQNLTSHFDLNQNFLTAVSVIAPILAVISVVMFIIILCFRGKTRNIDTDLFTQFNNDNENISMCANEDINNEKNIEITNIS